MERIESKVMDEERALYGKRGIYLVKCSFSGAADGESALKECSDVQAADCTFDLRYPMWHDKGVIIENCRLTPNCRAALWYSEDIGIKSSEMYGIKALRECKNVDIENTEIISPEFGWSVSDIRMRDSYAESEYFMLRSEKLMFANVRMKGKYSFQYITDSVFEGCVFDTKDAFWHAKNVTVRNCTVNGEYLGWYSENVTFENCLITGTQPLCYCKGLKLIGCVMKGTDLCFEKSEVEADITSDVISVKNPLKGTVRAKRIEKIIRDDENSEADIIVTDNLF